jgi:hypothetical protein
MNSPIEMSSDDTSPPTSVAFMDCHYDHKNRPKRPIFKKNGVIIEVEKARKLLKSYPILIIFQGTKVLIEQLETIAKNNKIQMPIIVDLKKYYYSIGRGTCKISDIAHEMGFLFDIEKEYKGDIRLNYIEAIYSKLKLEPAFIAWQYGCDPEDLDECDRQSPIKGTKYELGDKKFTTKKEIVSTCKDLLEKSPNGPVSPDHKMMMEALFGSGPITIGYNNTHNNRCFYKDGVPISFHSCIADLGNTPEENIRRHTLKKFKKAAREEIYPQIETFRDNNPHPPGEYHHVDHNGQSFVEILFKFCLEYGIKVSGLEFRNEDGSRVYFLDSKISELWRNWHAAHATLQWLSAKENMSKQPKRQNWDKVY